MGKTLGATVTYTTVVDNLKVCIVDMSIQVGVWMWEFDVGLTKLEAILYSRVDTNCPVPLHFGAS
ncbi:hypothetical protein AG1IA_06189 [Rhizoctonia solani AG-1 IA]|uniref:Uncharacterized protein n=1 Tax=Thanatephorus cucumeris (strain AG1-IA) TaxID=983506 RepID=L8WNS1_THACA|nr:hypothetical protein AG1IA_06189 [Rhizoctonia solani AG-1 IA]